MVDKVFFLLIDGGSPSGECGNDNNLYLFSLTATRTEIFKSLRSYANLVMLWRPTGLACCNTWISSFDNK